MLLKTTTDKMHDTKQLENKTETQTQEKKNIAKWNESTLHEIQDNNVHSWNKGYKLESLTVKQDSNTKKKKTQTTN